MIDESDYKIIDIQIQQYISQQRKKKTLTQKKKHQKNDEQFEHKDNYTFVSWPLITYSKWKKKDVNEKHNVANDVPSLVLNDCAQNVWY